MKQKYMAILLGAAMAVSMTGTTTAGLTVMAEEVVTENSTEDTAEAGDTVAPDETAKENDKDKDKEAPESKEQNSDGKLQEDENRIMGEIITVGENSITVRTDAGDETEISVTEDTVISGQSMGDPGASGEKPDGEALNENGEAPEKPDEAPDGNGEAPEKPDGGEQETLSFSDLAEEDKVMVTLNEDGTASEITVMSMDGGQGGMAPGGAPGGQQGAPESYEAVKEYTEDAQSDGESFASTGTDENAILVDGGAKVTVKDAEVSRKSADSTGGDTSSFYGVGAAVLAKDGTVTVSDSTIDTDAAGAAGVFAYGDGVAYVSDTDITTKQDTSGGIHVAGGGTLYAWNVNATNSGQSSAAIRSDRGGGTIVADGGSYTSNGVGSPAIYSTADIAVNDAQLTANGSEAVCIEGLNSIHLFNSDLTGNMADDEQNDCTWNVILYQSMSGDSEVGNSTFEMEGGTLTAKNGGMFYTTNTESTILLSDVEITYADDSEYFLRCTGNENRRGWGSVGSNGADCLFTAKAQEMQGNVIWDSISDLDFYMTEGSTLTGAVVDDESCAGEGGSGSCNFYISDDSTWVVTGDSTLTDLHCAGTITDNNGATVSVVGTDGTIYVDGDSEWTVTVESYEDNADMSGAAASTSWNDYAVEQQA